MTVKAARPVGGAGEHMQLTLGRAGGASLGAVWFRNGGATEAVRAASAAVDVVFELCQSTFGGEPSPELQVVELAPSGG